MIWIVSRPLYVKIEHVPAWVFLAPLPATHDRKVLRKAIWTVANDFRLCRGEQFSVLPILLWTVETEMNLIGGSSKASALDANHCFLNDGKGTGAELPWGTVAKQGMIENCYTHVLWN
jgi:hypothetical protein